MDFLRIGVVLVFLSLPAGGSFYDDDRLSGEPAIEALVAANITAGCGPQIFCPQAPVSRGQMVTFLGRALGEPPSDNPPGFPDVDDDVFYGGFATRLQELGVVVGQSDGTFGGERPVTRGEMAVFLARALKLDDRASAHSFSDVDPGAFYAGAVEAIRAAGVTLGCDSDRFCPDAPVIRHDMALFLARAFHLTTTVVPVRTSPLDGLPAPDGFSVNRRVLAVKIDNAAPARPQSGIEQADAMIELMVEGGLSRMMGLYLESDASYVGPVRSVRPTDALIESLGATVAISGGQPWIADLLGAEGVPIIREIQVRPPAMFRISGRRAPHNLYANTVELRREADRRGTPNEPPQNLFLWGDFAYPQAPGATTIDVSWSNPVSTVWDWDGVRYLRTSNTTPHYLVDQDGSSGRIAADNLVVIFGQYYEVAAPAGFGTSRVPAMNTIGSGRMVLFTEGRVVEGTWSRPDNETWFTFTNEAGELVVPPGLTWIHVIPHDRPLTWE
ncbi:hypothetical protein BH18ACT5_BH18ACT5_05090 [soil metagenome]